MNRTLLRVVGVAVAGGAVVAAATVVAPRSPAADTAAPTRVAVSEQTLVCPTAGATADAPTSLAAVSAEARTPSATAPPATAPPRLALLPFDGEVVDPTTDPLAEVRERGQVAAADFVAGDPDGEPGGAADADAVVVSASGALAPGVTAGQLTRATGGAQRGLAETPCGRPGSQLWFVGASGDVGHHAQLHLTNVEDVPARVSVRLFDESGPVESDNLRALGVEPGDHRVLDLDRLTPSSARLAVEVTTSQGRVAAALRTDAADDGTPVGVDWLPSAVPPARRLVVSGLAPGEGSRVLTVVAPDDSGAVVELSVLGAGGTFRPVEGGTLDVAPGTVGEVELEGTLAGEAAAVRLTSNVPVTAGVRNEVGADAEAREVAYGAAATPLTGAAAVPVTPAGGDRSATLVLSAVGDRPAVAEVRLVASDGAELAAHRVEVAPGTTLAHELEPPAGTRSYAVVVTPRGGPLVGTRVLADDADGPLLSQWPLADAPVAVVRPQVTADPRAALPD